MDIVRCALFCLFIINEAFSLNLDNEHKIINRTSVQDGRKQHEDYQLLKEYKGFCQYTTDCRSWAHVCRQHLCECADGYRPDATNQTCVGAIGKPCMYDSHCIPNAFCKGQTICTCKPEYPLESDDKWYCDDDSRAPKFAVASSMAYLFVVISYAFTYL